MIPPEPSQDYGDWFRMQGEGGRGALATPAGIHDAEDDDAVCLATVLDDVVPEVVLADVRRTAFGGMADVGKRSDALERALKNSIVDDELTFSPGCKGVSEDSLSCRAGLAAIR